MSKTKTDEPCGPPPALPIELEGVLRYCGDADPKLVKKVRHRLQPRAVVPPTPIAHRAEASARFVVLLWNASPLSLMPARAKLHY